MPPPTPPPSRGARALAGARTAAASTAKARLDLRHQPGVRVEELLVRLRPAAEVVHSEELGTHGEVEALRGARQHGAVAALCEEVLRGRRVEEVGERLCRRGVLAV